MNQEVRFPEVPEAIPAAGCCEGPLRQFLLKRLDEGNVRRSLAGALARSEGWPVVMISTRDGVKLPEELKLDTLYNGQDADWDLFEGYTRGIVCDGFLECFVSTKEDWQDHLQVMVRLAAIDRCDVSYCEKRA